MWWMVNAFLLSRKYLKLKIDFEEHENLSNIQTLSIDVTILGNMQSRCAHF